jgi:FKBP-type peptidyl-prolyl cis-trans isomerase
MYRVSCLAVLVLASRVDSWTGQSQASRRKVLLSAPAALLLPASSALAQPAEFANIGTQAPLPVGETSPFVTLPNGVQVKDFRISLTPDAPTVGPGSRVSFQCTGRLLNLNGVVFYSTKNSNVDGFGPEPLTVTLGKNELLPGLEAGIIGMKKGGIRRIIVPADLAYSKFPDLEPKPMSALDQRALDSVVKNPRRDATILFDVSIERVKN